MNASPRDAADWTIASYIAHNEALRIANDKFEAERDRRYHEVQEARDEAVRVKEESNREALRLARVAQDYRDERDNRMREQINLERGSYATKAQLDEFGQRLQAAMDAMEDSYQAAHKPVADYVAAQLGRRAGIGESTHVIYALLVLGVAVITAIVLYAGHPGRPSQTPAQTVTVTVPTK